MPKRNAALAGGLSILFLAACGNQVPESSDNAAVAAEPNALEPASPSDPARPDLSVNAVDPVPPPDAVSHPDGYLPPAPAEPATPAANGSATGSPPPATEDQYIRNGQAGR